MPLPRGGQDGVVGSDSGRIGSLHKSAHGLWRIAQGGVKYAEAANLYKSVLGPDVSVYCMVVPLGIGILYS